MDLAAAPDGDQVAVLIHRRRYLIFTAQRVRVDLELATHGDGRAHEAAREETRPGAVLVLASPDHPEVTALVHSHGRKLLVPVV